MKLWHDRAAFHFLIDQESRSAYVRCCKNALQPGGTLIVATFAQGGPEQCSGLPTMRYTPAILSSNLGLPSGSLKTFKSVILLPPERLKALSLADVPGKVRNTDAKLVDLDLILYGHLYFHES